MANNSIQINVGTLFAPQTDPQTSVPNIILNRPASAETVNMPSGGAILPVQFDIGGGLSSMSIIYTDKNNVVRTKTMDQIYQAGAINVPLNNSIDQVAIPAFETSLQNLYQTIWGRGAFAVGETVGPVVSSTVSSPSHSISSPYSGIYINPSIINVGEPITISWPTTLNVSFELSYFYYWYKVIICGPPLSYSFVAAYKNWRIC